MKKFSVVLFVIVLLSNTSLVKAQSACCGLDILGGMLLESGIYGGYGAQQFSATGFNDYIKVYNDIDIIITYLPNGAIVNIQESNDCYEEYKIRKPHLILKKKFPDPLIII